MGLRGANSTDTRKEDNVKKSLRIIGNATFLLSALLTSPALAGDIAQDRQDIKADKQDIKQDRQDLRKDLRELREDRQDLEAAKKHSNKGGMLRGLDRADFVAGTHGQQGRD